MKSRIKTSTDFHQINFSALFLFTHLSNVSQLQLNFSPCNSSFLTVSIPPSSTSRFFPPSLYQSPISISLTLYLCLQLSQCNVNDVPSIAPDSARTLTSPLPLFFIALSSLSFSHPSLTFPLICSSFLHLTYFISLSPLSSMSLVHCLLCHISSVPFPSFQSLSFMFLFSSIVLSEHLLSPTCAIFYLSSSLLFLSFSLFLLIKSLIQSHHMDKPMRFCPLMKHTLNYASI